MSCKSFWERFASFILSFAFSLCVVNFAQTLDFWSKKQEEISVSQNVKLSKNIVSPSLDQGMGCGECNLNQSVEQTCFACIDGKFTSPEKLQPTKKLSSDAKKLKILSKPRPNYTVEARENFIEGKVRLRVQFLANGEIGNINPVEELPYGLTEQSVAAAEKIKFEPAKRNGVPYTVVKQVEYNFMIY